MPLQTISITGERPRCVHCENLIEPWTFRVLVTEPWNETPGVECYNEHAASIGTVQKWHLENLLDITSEEVDGVRKRILVVRIPGLFRPVAKHFCKQLCLETYALNAYKINSGRVPVFEADNPGSGRGFEV